MITSLSQLSMHRYINLVCGDTSVLFKKGEEVTASELENLRGKLMLEFANLSNSISAKKYMATQEKVIRSKAEVTLFQLCYNLCKLNAYEEVRELYKQYGYTKSITDEQLSNEIDRLLAKAKRELAKLTDAMSKENSESSTDEQIRTSFERQTAALMAYFKFQIDTHKMSASQYACLIDQANTEIKAKYNAVSKR